MSKDYDVVVVGAGPAGSTAALIAARAGLSVLVLERGERVGSKNVSGAMFMCRALADIIPEFADEAPLERPVKTQNVLMASKGRCVTASFSNPAFLEAPYNGFTVLKAEFDRWLAGKAREAGATIVTKTVVDSLLVENGRVCGVRARRDGGAVRSNLVILADGVNSMLAERAGLKRAYRPDEVSLGVKELLALPSATIEDRFGLERGEGASFSAIGDFARGIPGGGFIYTNKESLSVGVVLSGVALAKKRTTADDALEAFKAIPEVARLVRGAELVEYGAHLIPEGGLSAVPQVYGNGYMIAGDAAGLVVNTGLTLQGINLAILSGKCAGETAISALKRGDCSADAFRTYEELMKGCAALGALEAHPRSAELMTTSRMFNEYPDMVNDMFERLVTVEPGRQNGVLEVFKDAKGDLKTKELLHDVMVGVRAL